jgi:hypothetical protein
MNEHEKKIEEAFSHLCGLFKLKGFSLRFMRRMVDEEGKGILNLKKSYNLAYADLKKRLIVIDIYTPRHRKPKALNSILRVLAHEIAHFQKLPYRQYHRGKWIVRQHYPAFYKQVNKNVDKIKKHKAFRDLFR